MVFKKAPRNSTANINYGIDFVRGKVKSGMTAVGNLKGVQKKGYFQRSKNCNETTHRLKQRGNTKRGTSIEPPSLSNNPHHPPPEVVCFQVECGVIQDVLTVS